MIGPNEDIQRLITISRNKFRTLVDGIADQVMSIDSGFRIISVNMALAEATGRKPKELIGDHCHRVLYGSETPCPTAGRPCPVEAARRHRQLEVGYHEIPGPDGDSGQSRFFEIRAMPVSGEPHDQEEIILVRRDITIQRRAEIQIREHNKRLEAEVYARTRELREANELLTQQRNELEVANRELMELNRLKEDLTNMVVHDLKGPLAEIVANLELMASQPLNELQAEFLEASRLGADGLQRMIMNLLDISRMEEDRLILDITFFDAGRLIQELVSRFQPLARLNDVALTADVPDDLPLMAADPHLFERILINIISNALDYTPSLGRVLIRAWISDDEYVYEIRDTGQGIPPELHARIFQKFTQGEDGRPKTSSGLGLTFCKMAVEAHGGRIWVESALGQGSRFFTAFPRNRLTGESAN